VSPADRTPRNILVVDDEPDFRETVASALKREGYGVLTASNGDEALTVYVENTVDLVIIDMLMPERDGIETIRALRRHDPNLPIIATSGGGVFDATLYLETARRMRVVETLNKPFSLSELLLAVYSALRRK
jgi:DNA-binding response OmpR family regulator